MVEIKPLSVCQQAREPRESVIKEEGADTGHLHIVEEEENLDVESPDNEAMVCSDTSCSLSEVGSPRATSFASTSPVALAAMMPSSDSPHSSSEVSSLSHGSVNTSSGQEKRHICEMCGKGFPYLSILESHKRCHTGEKPFNCHFCDKKFAQKATLQVHERTHTGERPYKCRYCEKTFAQYGTKTVHEKSAHLGIRNYKCPMCDKCLSSPSALYTHKKTHGEKIFQCEFCPKTFTLKNYLKLHVKQVHEQNERKHTCRFCGKSFAYAGSLQVHVRTHTGERPYACRFCPKAFASQGNLQSHERTHTGERPYTCGTCGRSFIQKSQLTAHEATHSLPAVVATETEGKEAEGERKGADYVCKYCGKRYSYASSLYVHTRQHTGERPFRCQFCDKKFTNQGNMQVHLRVHTGEKPYSCSACGKSYAQKVGLKIHLEQCQPYLTADRTSESPINVDTDSDGSDEPVRKMMKAAETVPVPNIYQNVSTPSLCAPLPTYAQLSASDFGIKMPTVTNNIPFPGMQSPQAIGRPSELAPPDFGPLTASKPPFQPDVCMPEAFSAFAPVKSENQAPPPLLDNNFFLKNLFDMGLGANLLQPAALQLSQQLLNTQMLLQQLQSADFAQLASSLPAAYPGAASLPQQPASLPQPPASLLNSLLSQGLLGQGLLQPMTQLQHYEAAVPTETMLA